MACGRRAGAAAATPPGPLWGSFDPVFVSVTGTNEGSPSQEQYLYFFARKNGKEYVHFANELEQETLSSFDKDDELQVVRVESVIKNTGKRYTALHWSVPGQELPPALFSEQTRLTEPQEKRETLSRQRDRCIAYQSVAMAHD